MRRGTLLLTVDGLGPGLFGNAAEILWQARSMPSAGDVIYHVMNRGNCRMDVFQKPGDFAAFATILEEGRQRVRMRILAYCLMSDHWHIMGQDAPRLAAVESRRRRRSTSSRLRRRGRRRVRNWPNGLLARPTGRVERVNARVAKEELRATPVVRPAQPAIRQTTPGVRRTARRLGLEPTLPNWRPNKPPAAEASCGVWDVERAGWKACTTKREGGAFTRAANGGGLVLQTRRDRGSSFRMLHPAGRGLDRSWPNPRCPRSAAG
jgi:REP element-mobilizing transposase RayT